MKKLFRILLIAVLTAALLTGCGKVSDREIPARETEPNDYGQVQPSENGEVTDDADAAAEATVSTDISSMADSIFKEGWPAENVPAELPEYTDGGVANSGGDASDYIILVEGTSIDALTIYAEELKNAGWIVTGGDASSGFEAMLGVYEANFQWNNSKSTFLQIEIYTSEAGEWPYDDIPPDFLPPQTGTMVEAPIVIDLGDDMWYFNFTVDGIDEEASADYMRMLMDNGWTGEILFVSKDVDWNGKQYGLSMQILETIETRTTFTGSFNKY